MADNRLIVALDFPDMEAAKNLVSDLGKSVDFYKVGMELFYSVGQNIIMFLHEKKKKIFLDLKLHDIPNTVSKGLVSLMQWDVDMLNIHAMGGYTMMKTAARHLHEAAEAAECKCPDLLAVTVLTSMGEPDWQGLKQTCTIKEQVVNLACLAQKAGLSGVVASPLEASAIRKACGEKFLIVTPGIRPVYASADDQNRIASPAKALENGATHLVVGRPIRLAEYPQEAAEKIIAEMEMAKI